MNKNMSAFNTVLWFVLVIFMTITMLGLIIAIGVYRLAVGVITKYKVEYRKNLKNYRDVFQGLPLNLQK